MVTKLENIFVVETPQWPLMPFPIVINLFLVFYSFTENQKTTLILSLLNIFLLIIPLIMLCFKKYLKILLG
jgi:hypothetical protein